MTANAQKPHPLPMGGQRTLTAKETVMRSQALACNVPEKNTPSCRGQVYLGVFFDGTGNNRDCDLPQHQQSNVVRLWNAHFDNSNYKVTPPVFWRREYIPGVGTPFPEIGELGVSKMGKAFANGGQSRIFWGLIQALNALHRYVMYGSLMMQSEEAGQFARGEGDKSSANGIAKLRPKVNELKAKLLNAKPMITQFNISVFGFSRGAAEARVFCNWFYELCEKSGDAYTFAGVPVRIYFLGIFDTVAAVNLTSVDLLKNEASSGHKAWADGTLAIHPAIERCVHFVASHEVRGCFPVDLVRSNGTYPSNCYEVVYPGAHSDVGGGYKPSTQGRSALPADGASYSFSALLPCIDMHKEAIASGVPLKTVKQMLTKDARNFTASPETVNHYNAYLKADTVSGTVEAILKQRMHRYRAYRYKKLKTFVNEAIARGSPSPDADFLRLTNDDFTKQCEEFKRRYANIANIIKKRNSLDLDPVRRRTKAEREQENKALFDREFHPEDREMWEGMHRVDLPDAVVTFLDLYIHDSMAGFAQDGVHEYKFNGRGHFRNRNVYDKGGK